MLTQCPNCETRFRVTSEILRVAQGQVRCGRCHAQFDALESLVEEGVPEDSVVEPLDETPAEAQEPAQESITLEGRHIEITGTYLAPGDLSDDAEPQIHHRTTEAWVAEEWTEADDDAVAPVATTVAADQAIADQDEWPSAATTLAAATDYSDFDAPDAETSTESPDAEEFELLAPRRPRTRLVWKLLALPLALALGAQIVHHYRAELARHPRLGEPTLRLYEVLGLRLTPDWNLHAYEIKQWGILSDPTHPGTLKVRASVTNRAAFAQPYPLLKLVLEDRWGDQVRVREFEPSEYLDPAVASNRLLAPGQLANASIVIADPGPDAEGFRFDVCLRGATGLVCAEDVPE